MKVRINIDRLVLNGFGREDAGKFARGLERELSKLVRENAVAADSNIDMLDAEMLRLAHGIKPDLAGAHTARMIFRGLERK